MENLNISSKTSIYTRPREVEFDGTKFLIESDGKPRGLTSNQFYEFELSPVE